ncbi:MAG: hypothetical protein WC291_05690 [Thermodesulfovibrionales bacterium]|jgi:hypothetical protein
MKKELQIGYRWIEDWKVYILRIIKQTHRGEEFGEGGSDCFVSSNGFTLYSCDSPEIGDVESSHLFVRGNTPGKDDTVLVTPSSAWMTQLLNAVGEYNKRGEALAKAEEVLHFWVLKKKGEERYVISQRKMTRRHLEDFLSSHWNSQWEILHSYTPPEEVSKCNDEK